MWIRVKTSINKLKWLSSFQLNVWIFCIYIISNHVFNAIVSILPTFKFAFSEIHKHKIIIFCSSCIFVVRFRILKIINTMNTTPTVRLILIG